MFRADYAAMSSEQLVDEAANLKDLLEQERKRANAYAEELRLEREKNVAVQKQVEQEEEMITNRLMKRLEQLKKEKQVLAMEVEQEEEFLTNTLQKRLQKLNKEKTDLEVKLQQLNVEKSKLHRDKVDLENQLEAEQEYISNRLAKQLEKLGGEKGGLQRERSELQRQVTDLAASVDKLNKEKVMLESTLEMEEECITNKLQRQLEGLLNNFRAIEQKLEAKGLTLKDVGINPQDLRSDAWVYNRSTSRASSGECSWGSMRTGSGDMHRINGSRRERPHSASSSGSALQPSQLHTAGSPAAVASS